MGVSCKIRNGCHFLEPYRNPQRGINGLGELYEANGHFSLLGAWMNIKMQGRKKNFLKGVGVALNGIEKVLFVLIFPLAQYLENVSSLSPKRLPRNPNPFLRP